MLYDILLVIADLQYAYSQYGTNMYIVYKITITSLPYKFRGIVYFHEFFIAVFMSCKIHVP